MKKFCLVYGGDSLEAEISILTALKVQKELEKFSYPYMMVYLDHDGNFYTGKSLLFKTNYTHLTKFKKGNFEKNNQHYYFKTKFKKEEFDVVMYNLKSITSSRFIISLGSFFIISYI